LRGLNLDISGKIVDHKIRFYCYRYNYSSCLFSRIFII